MTDRGLLQLGCLAREYNESVSALQDLHHNDHLFILEQVKGTCLEVRGILEQHLTDLFIKLALHGLEEVPVGDLIFRIGLNRGDCRPAP